MKKYLQGVSENQKSPANTLGEKKILPNFTLTIC